MIKPMLANSSNHIFDIGHSLYHCGSTPKRFTGSTFNILSPSVSSNWSWHKDRLHAHCITNHMSYQLHSHLHKERKLRITKPMLKEQASCHSSLPLTCLLLSPRSNNFLNASSFLFSMGTQIPWADQIHPQCILDHSLLSSMLHLFIS